MFSHRRLKTVGERRDRLDRLIVHRLLEFLFQLFEIRAPAIDLRAATLLGFAGELLADIAHVLDPVDQPREVEVTARGPQIVEPGEVRGGGIFRSAVKESETGIQRSKMLDETDEFLQALGPQRYVAERLLDLLKLCRVQSGRPRAILLTERWKRIPFTAAALGESAVHNSLTSCRM